MLDVWTRLSLGKCIAIRNITTDTYEVLRRACDGWQTVAAVTGLALKQSRRGDVVKHMLRRMPEDAAACWLADMHTERMYVVEQGKCRTGS
jgi:hypothetical protein